MRRRAFLILLLGAGAFFALPAARPAAAAAIEGFLAAGAISADSDAASPEWAWRDGFLGRLDAADEERFQAEGLFVIEAGGGAAAGGGAPVSLVLQAALRHGYADRNKSVAGLAQAFGKYERGWGEHPENRLAVKLGFFFLPSSRENVEIGWSSPYTLTYSALNTWIGEEVRPLGLEASLRRGFGEHSLEASAIVFGGNDAAGALLAWRGFAMSGQVTLLDEVLPLPALPSLASTGAFSKQRDDGSQSFSDDLDGRPGYYLALRWQKKWANERQFILQADHWDNRGDRHLYQGEYAWATRYDHLAFELDALPGLKLLGEWLGGETGMGLPTRVMVDAEFEAAYLLASWQRGPFRLSLRRDEFEVEDYDDFSEPTGDQGKAWTAALLFDTPAKAWRFGLEWLEVHGEHPAATLIGADPTVLTRSLRLEVRYYFGS